MARKLRVFFTNISHNIVIQGINGEKIFKNTEDLEYATSLFQQLVNTFNIHIHSYVFMPTFIQLYATPLSEEALPKFMQNFGRLYVRYFNKKYNRTGTLWNGRYKCSVVEDILYMFDMMKYIEKQPLKNKLVNDINTYKYSSYHHNSNQQLNTIIKEHILYKQLGNDKNKQSLAYIKIFNKAIESEKETFIKTNIEKQNIIGSVGFYKNLEKKVGLSLSSKQRGRPKQTNKQRKSMYKKLAVLDKVTHKDLKVKSLENLSFAKDLSFVPVVANEVGLVGNSFPVVFTGDEKPSLVSIVSLGGSSLAVNSENKWITPYVPLHLRKYPFSMANTEQKDQKVILIDEESDLVNTVEGATLFEEDIEQTEVLANAVKFLTDVETQQTNTLTISKIISDSGILEDREITVGEGDEKKVFVNGFKVVNKEKLNALDDKILAQWVRKGIISFIDAHIASLNNIQTLFNLASKKQ